MSAVTGPQLEPSPTGGPRLLPAAEQRLGDLRRRARIGIAVEALAVLLVAFASYAALTLLVDRNLRLEVPVRGVLVAVFAVVVWRIARRRLVRPLAVRLDDDEMALAVERQTPELHEALISAMQFERALDRGPVKESPVLMRAVVADVHGRLASLPFAAALDGKRVRQYALQAGGCALAFVAWAAVDPQSLGLWARRNLFLSAVEWPRYTRLEFVGVEQGRVRLPLGDPLTVRVAIGGPVPDQVFLRSHFASGEVGAEPMRRTGDGEYTLTIETLLENVELQAEGGDGISEPVRVEIVERPRIEGVAIEVRYPEYMHKEPETVPGTEGELRLVRGSELRISGRSHKPIGEAFLLFADQKHSLQREGDHDFHGVLEPKTSGLLVVDVLDRDSLGAGSPPRVQVRIVDDKPPTMDFKLRGISTLVTPQVRMPGDIEVKDDFGVTSVAAAWRVVDDAAARKDATDPGAAPPPEPPFTAIDITTVDALEPGALRFKTAASIDFKGLAHSDRDDDPQNPIRPGMLLSVRLSAKDNFGPGEPHTAVGETVSFRVVTREKLIDELRRRQVEQRQEVQRIRDDVQLAQSEVAECPSPSGTDARATGVRTKLKGLSARQQALGRRASFAADLYQRILWEYENNRIWEPSKVREYEGLTSVPLAALAKEAFPASAQAVGAFADRGDEELRAGAVAQYKEILGRLEAIIKVMEQVETLAALIEQLRGVINVEDRAIKEVEKRIKEAGESIFKKK